MTSHSSNSTSDSNSAFTTYGYNTFNSDHVENPNTTTLLTTKSRPVSYTITIENPCSENMKRKQLRTCAKCILNTNAVILGIVGLIGIISSLFTYFSETGFNDQFMILLIFGLSLLIFSILTCVSVSKFGMTMGLCSCGGLLIITLFTILTSYNSSF